MTKRGKITRNGVKLERHENKTVAYFANLGRNIELIPPSNTPRAKTADFMMDGLVWEMKSPTSTNLKTLEHNFLRGLKQSCNIVIDIRRINDTDRKVLDYLRKLFKQTRSCRKMIIITKDKMFTLNK